MAQTDFFLKIDGIPGESEDQAHKGELDIESWSWGASNAGSMDQGGGGGSGRSDFTDITIAKRADRATPKLLMAVATGDHIKSMLLTCRKAGGKGGQVEYLKVFLTDVVISGYNSSAGGGSPIAMESISINYARIKYEYQPQKADGSLDGKVAFEYDRKTHKAT